MRTVAYVSGVLLLGLVVVVWAGLALEVGEDPPFLRDAIFGGVLLTAAPLGLGWLLIRIGRNRGPWHVLMSRRRRGKLAKFLVPGENLLQATFVTAPGTRRRQVIAVTASGAVAVGSTLALESLSAGMIALAISLIVGEIVASSFAPTDLGLGVLLLTDQRVLIVDRSQLSGGLKSLRVAELSEGLVVSTGGVGQFPTITLMFASGRHLEVEMTRSAAVRFASVAERSRRDPNTGS